MQTLTIPALEQYWTGAYLTANLLIGLNLVGALLLGMLVGYERSYHGRAAGMRTYGLVCMASTALTVFVGYSKFWYGGQPLGLPVIGAGPDPTRVVQGIVTGIGFLCGGVIVKDGMNISGLTTAASIWAAASIGVMLGVGFYGAALLLAVLCAVSMSLLHRVERRLPAQRMLSVSLTFRPGFVPKLDVLERVSLERGYRVQANSLTIAYDQGRTVWKFFTLGMDKSKVVVPARLAEELTRFEGVESFQLTPSHT